jgi:hypothetical protein
MPLICPNCKTVNQDPGGDPRFLACGRCGRYGLQRTVDPRIPSGIAGAAIGGLLGAAMGVEAGPIGALIGGLIGLLVASRRQMPR